MMSHFFVMGCSKMKVAIVGGSISGCAIAALLSNEHSIRVYERSAEMSARGAGITIAPHVLNLLIECGLVDRSIPTCPFEQRSFHTASPLHPSFGLQIWQQPVRVLGMHWNELYQNLKKRIPPELISYGKGVKQVKVDELSKKPSVTLDDDAVEEFDLLVFADGSHSLGRKLINPGSNLDYSGYVAWRGVIDFEKVKDKKPFLVNIPYHCYKNGHLLAYLIEHDGRKKLNWVFYEKMSLEKFGELSIENPHQLPEVARLHLEQLSKSVLSKEIREVVLATPDPFVQTIKDCTAEALFSGPMCTLGDASMVLRPHVGSGASMAIEDALALSNSLREQPDLVTALESYQHSRLAERQKMIALSRRMAQNLVLEPLSWALMDSKAMDKWWQSVLANETWYTVPTSQCEEGVLTSTSPLCGD